MIASAAASIKVKIFMTHFLWLLKNYKSPPRQMTRPLGLEESITYSVTSGKKALGMVGTVATRPSLNSNETDFAPPNAVA